MDKNICVFGASSTWGAYDLEKGGWVERLKLYFDDDFVYNLGISGDNSEDLLKRIKIECEARYPHLILISIGDNDSVKNYQVSVSKEKFEKNMVKIVKIAKKFTKNIILLGTKIVDEKKTCPVNWDKNLFYKNDDIHEYDLVLEKVARIEGVKYLKMSDLLEINDLSDGLHPNSKGHEKIFFRVRDFIKKES